MSLIHAFRRTAVHSVDLFGKKFEFKPNEAGDFVAELPAGPAHDRLLEITEGYRPYETEKADDDADDPDAQSPYILTVEGDEGAEKTIDLRELAGEQLREFAKENEVPFHPNAKDATVRDKIVAFFKGE